MCFMVICCIYSESTNDYVKYISAWEHKFQGMKQQPEFSLLRKKKKEGDLGSGGYRYEKVSFLDLFGLVWYCFPFYLSF